MEKRIIVVAGGFVAALLVFILLTRGCRLPGSPNESSLVGHYRASWEKDRYFLELRADNTYSQRIVRADGSELTNKGYWESKYSHAQARIELSNFKAFRAGRLQSSGSWVGSVGRTLLGRTKLAFADYLVSSYASPLPQEKDPNE